MLEAAKQLLKPSKRSDVPPFIVMDVMAAAAQREAQGAHIIHMEVGQPAAPAPAVAIKAAQAALGTRPYRLYRNSGNTGAACAHRAPLRGHLRSIPRSGTCGGDYRLIRRVHPGLPVIVRAWRPGGIGQPRLSAISAYPLRTWMRARANRDFGRDALGAVGQGADRRAPMRPAWAS